MPILTGKHTQRDARLQQGIIVALLILFIIVVVKSAWISHDAYITYRTVENFVNGYGLVWNPGERVQAYTHPLWMFLLAAARWGTGELFYSVYTLSIILTLSALLLFVRRIAYSLSGAILGLLILLCAKTFVDYTTSGLENPLNHFLLALFYTLFLGTHPQRVLLGSHEPSSHESRSHEPSNSAPWTRPFSLAFVTALGGLARIDLLILFLPGLLYEWWQSRRLRTMLLMALGFLPLILWELFSLFYYGFLFPNTAYAKLNAGIEKSQLITQGIFYLIRTVNLDALTVVIIGIGMVLPILLRQRRNAILSISILLYLLYIVWIGGDFMANRFLAAPLLCATFALSQAPLPNLNQISAYALGVGIVGLSLLNPATSPLLVTDVYKTETDDNQVEDMRAHHLDHTDLLNATVDNRLYEQGRIKGANAIGLYLNCVGMGPGEYYNGPNVYIVDVCALTDALLARLPAIYTPDLFSGHYFRTVPDGYLQTLRQGTNQIADEQLAEFYDKLTLVTKGEIWDPDRLQTIWRMNLGAYDDLIDFNRYRYPNVVTVTSGSMSRTHEGEAKPLVEKIRQQRQIETSGWLLSLDRLYTSHFIDVGWDADYFQVTYFLENEFVAQQTVGVKPIAIDNEQVNVVAVPASAQKSGFNSVRFLPLRPGRSMLNYVDLVSLPDGEVDVNKTSASSIQDIGMAGEQLNYAEFEQMLRLYDFIWLRYLEPEREHYLAQIYKEIEAIPFSYWQALSPSIRLSLLNKPDHNIQALLYNAFEPKVLVNDEDTPLLQFWGVTSESNKYDASEDGTIEDGAVKNDDRNAESEGDNALLLHLYFEVLNPIRKDYSAWVSLDSVHGQDKWMLYDQFPQRPIHNWVVGEIVDFQIFISMEPGQYDVKAGFWTPNVRERLYVEHDGDDEIYWLELGEHIVRQ
ncbi:MAG: hypothetical protein AAF702_11385 [Chloroflexota bacterium]